MKGWTGPFKIIWSDQGLIKLVIKRILSGELKNVIIITGILHLQWHVSLALLKTFWPFFSIIINKLNFKKVNSNGKNIMAVHQLMKVTYFALDKLKMKIFIYILIIKMKT